MKNIFIFLFLLLANHFSFCQWSTSATDNNPVCVTANQQQAPRVVSDGSGGAIFTWWDLNLATSDYNIYAQRITANGTVQWTVNGIGICTDPALQHVPEMISDGNGGAIITWQDNRNADGDIYAQRVNASGTVQWAADGVLVCAAVNYQTSPQLISDGNGGAIVTWQDLRNSSAYRPYAQKINADGVAQWAANGVILNYGSTEIPQIISDGNGGAIITWHQFKEGNFDIYAQHINANGMVTWGINSLRVCSLLTNQYRPQIISDGNHGAIIVWEDYRNSSAYSNLYAQKINAEGIIQWAANGVAIALNSLSQIRQKLLSDGSGGAFITWQYASGGLINTIYAQRINLSGIPQWAADGVSIGRAGESGFPAIATDGGTGGIITWYDYRNSGTGDIFAQRFNSAGTVLWVDNGVDVCRNSAGQVYPRLIENGSGGAILTWEDERNSADSSSDIYAAKLNADGTLGNSVLSLTFTFTGNGNWDVPANWNNSAIPPSPLPADSSIIIDPEIGGQCMLNVTQHISTGASITIMPGKNLVISGSLNIQ